MGLILLDPIFFILTLSVYVLYKREIKKIQMEIDERQYQLHMAKNMLVGILIGVFISGVMQYYNLQMELTYDVLVLIPIAIVLLLIGPKWGCFSYVLTAAYILQGILELLGIQSYSLEYEKLLVLVGTLHLIEGLLVIVNGDKYSIQVPLYEESKLKVGYVLRQIWLVPLFFIIEGTVIPTYTLLAYGDLTTKPKQQKYITGILIFIYGIVVVGMGYGTIVKKMAIGATIILMPVLHEFIFILSHPKCTSDKNRESR